LFSPSCYQYKKFAHTNFGLQVQVHELWGKLLLGFAVFRCMSYFFVWLAPPRSALPSRPPTEALASFMLSCGGLVFMMSSEELGFAAMRRGRDGELDLGWFLIMCEWILTFIRRCHDVPYSCSRRDLYCHVLGIHDRDLQGLAQDPPCTPSGVPTRPLMGARKVESIRRVSALAAAL
jgi:hypothetical protein